MNSKLRIILPLAILALGGIGFAIYAPVGTLDAFGWSDLAIICPLGALAVMIAGKTLIPRAIVSVVIGVIAIVLLGRMFCGWICPAPVISKLRGISKKGGESEARKRDFALTEEEIASLKGCSGACDHGCGSCASKSGVDSRHIILLGALLSTAIFGFPVFCMVCPIGLSFGAVFLVISLFGAADVSWTVVAIPLLLAVELIFFRKWCTHLCPMSAFMSLISKLNRKTLQPTIDNSKCIEKTKGVECDHCAEVCPVAINPRHPELGADFAECIKCRACVEACPGHALSLPFLPAKKEAAEVVAAVEE